MYGLAYAQAEGKESDVHAETRATVLRSLRLPSATYGNTERRGKRLEDLAGADRSDHVRCVKTVARVFS